MLLRKKVGRFLIRIQDFETFGFNNNKAFIFFGMKVEVVSFWGPELYKQVANLCDNQMNHE